MIDTHCHLCDKRFDKDREDVLRRAFEAGVTHFVEIAYAPAIVGKAHDLARLHPNVFLCVGVHPSESARVPDDYLATLRDHTGHARVVAIGETGLDYYRDYAPRDRQDELFRAHCQLAVRLGKPLVIHSRAADEDTAAVLTTLPSETRVVLHCFSSTGLLAPALEHGWYVSFAGNVTYPAAADLRAAAARIPADRLLAETDSPYLAPQPVRGRRNEPANVVHTLASLAEARGVAPQELEAVIDANASAVFGLP